MQVTKELKEKSWAGAVKSLQEVNTTIICRRFGWCEEDYIDYMLDSANYQYDIYASLGCIRTDKGDFMKWFVNQWRRADVLFLQSAHALKADKWMEMYTQQHDFVEIGLYP